MADDRVRVDRAAVQTHADDTNNNNAAFRGSAESVDRQQQHLQQMTEDGAGSEEFGAVRAGTRHATEEVNSNVTKLVNRTSENADEFITNVNHAAQKNLRHI